MKTLPHPVQEAAAAVAAYKHALLIRVMAEIVRRALASPLGMVSPAEVPEEIVAPEHRQGVASNAWNALVALEILRRASLDLVIPERGIFGGRVRNGNGKAKGRWVAVYGLASRERARTWARANGVDLAEANAAPVPVQDELGLN
jgi:hypothetical protein